MKTPEPERGEQAQADADRAGVRDPVAAVGRPARVLALNQAVGNRALARLVDRSSRAQSTRQLQRAAVQVNEFVTEKTDASRTESVNWRARYQVELTEGRCTATIKVRLNPDAGVTEDEVKKVKAAVPPKFGSYFSGRFMFYEPGLIEGFLDDKWVLVADVEFVDSGEHLTVALHKGKGADNRQNWYVDTPAITKAHELGHQLGLLDEYVEEGVVPRKDASAPGVFTDNSIMGDYYKEGVDKADVKPRHGTRLAQVIGRAVGKTLKSKMITVSTEYVKS
jgi:hypothetical protein